MTIKEIKQAASFLKGLKISDQKKKAAVDLLVKAGLAYAKYAATKK